MGLSMEMRSIHTDAEYREVLREVSAYFEREPEFCSHDGDRFELLLTELEAYEAKHFLAGDLEREFVETSGGNDDSLSRF